MIKQKADPSKRFAFIFSHPTTHQNAILKNCLTALLPDLHAARHPKSSGNSGEYSDNNVENLAP